jgi:hypothetical protein
MAKDNRYSTFSICIEAIHDPQLQQTCLRSQIPSRFLDFTIVLGHGLSGATPIKDNGLGQFFPQTRKGYFQSYRTSQVTKYSMNDTDSR